MLFNFYQFFHLNFWSKVQLRINITFSCQISSLLQFVMGLQSSFVFLWPWYFWKTTGQFFCRIPLNLVCHFFQLDWSYAFLAGIITKWYYALLSTSYEGVLLKIYIRSCQETSVSFHFSENRMQTLLRPCRIYSLCNLIQTCKGKHEGKIRGLILSVENQERDLLPLPVLREFTLENL